MSREAPRHRPTPVARLHQAGGPVQPGAHGMLDLGDHRAPLTPPRASPLVIATPMVAKPSYDKATRGLVVVPWAQESAAPGRRMERMECVLDKLCPKNLFYLDAKTGHEASFLIACHAIRCSLAITHMRDTLGILLIIPTSQMSQKHPWVKKCSTVWNIRF